MKHDFSLLRKFLLSSIEVNIVKIENHPYNISGYNFYSKEIFRCLDYLKELDLLEKRLNVEL